MGNLTHALCILYGHELGAYGFDDSHPFSHARLPAFWKEFTRRGLDQRTAVEAPEICGEEVIASFHTQKYIEFVKEASHSNVGYLDAGDTPTFKGIFEASARVVGTTLKALRVIMAGKYQRAFCPIGGLHHARRNQAGGFCVFNDIGVAIEQLKQVYEIHRIAYVDIDAHHGDGVYYAFESDPEVFIADIHEDGTFLYPGSGSIDEVGLGLAKGTKLNLPMLPGSDDQHFMKALERVETFIHEVRPQIILFQCGADSIAGDPIAQLRFSPECHAAAARRLRSLAEKYAHGRLIVMGGGGYNLPNIAAAWCAVVEALL